MQLFERYGIESAGAAEGQVVVIDVLRAFTTAAYAFAAGTESIFLVRDVEEAFALKRDDPSLLLAGEVDGRPIPGFDFGNSPAAISKADLKGRRLVLRSSSGTQGVTGAARADAIWLGSLVVAGATAAQLRRRKPDKVTLLAMGSPRHMAPAPAAPGSGGPATADDGRAGQEPLDCEEDLACSAYLAGLLGGKPVGVEETVARMRSSPAARQALERKVDWISPEDVACACEVDRFAFAMAVAREGGLLVARPVPG